MECMYTCVGEGSQRGLCILTASSLHSLYGVETYFSKPVICPTSSSVDAVGAVAKPWLATHQARVAEGNTCDNGRMREGERCVNHCVQNERGIETDRSVLVDDQRGPEIWKIT